MPGVVEAKSVKKSSFHAPNPLWMRLNVTPFIVVYVLLLGAYFFKYEEWEDSPLLILPIIVLLHILSVISCYWSVHIRTFLTCRSVKQVKVGVLVKIIPVANKGSSTLVPIEYRSEDQKFFISWRKRIFFWNEKELQFQKIRYPIDFEFTKYLQSQGYHSKSEIQEALLSYDNNKYVITMFSLINRFKMKRITLFLDLIFQCQNF